MKPSEELQEIIRNLYQISDLLNEKSKDLFTLKEKLKAKETIKKITNARTDLIYMIFDVEDIERA